MKIIIATILFAFSVCAFADGEGTCTLVTNADGTFRIVCTGDGVIQDYETVTNIYAYEILNCAELKTDLQLYLSTLVGDKSEHYGILNDIREPLNYLDYLASENLNNINSADSSAFPDYDKSVFDAEDIQSQVNFLNDSIDYVFASVESLTNQIDNIKCCTTNNPSGGGSCSSPCDLTPIIDKLNTIVGYYNQITNKFNAVYEKLGGSSHLGYKYIDTDYHLNPNAGLRYFNWNSSKTPYINLLNLALHSQYNNAFGLASANNYLHKLTFLETPYISTNLEILVNESTNFFSFFRGEVGVKGALEDWDYSQGSYYDYLTNHYLSVIFNPSELSESQLQKTNWFSRIETLLAALVFADSEGTNTVDSSQFSDERERLISSLGELDYTTKSRLQQFENTSVSLLSSVRRFSAAFSNASLPNRVNLISIGNSDSEMIYFETSEISPFLEACHCVTTLIWCFGGLILLFWFIHFTLKSCYNLVVFGWSVVSAVFGK